MGALKIIRLPSHLPCADLGYLAGTTASKNFRLHKLLEPGGQVHPSADIEAIEDLLLKVWRLVEEVPEIAELDLNPVMALQPGQGC